VHLQITPLNPAPSQKIKLLPWLYAYVHRQGFSLGVPFSTKKVDDLFLVVALKTNAKTTWITSHRPDLPNFLKKLTLALPRGCTLCLGCTYNFPR